MKWSILILTKESRTDVLDRLLTVLGPQIANRFGEVELLVRTYDPRMPLGEARQLLVDEAQGEYCNFVDDDDLVPFDYVERILAELGPVDMVGFNVGIWIDGKWSRTAFHSLANKNWREDSTGCYRDLSHLNPVRTKFVRMVKFEGTRGEDHRWANGLRELDVVKTEKYINDMMYLYLFRSNKQEGEYEAKGAR